MMRPQGEPLQASSAGLSDMGRSRSRAFFLQVKLLQVSRRRVGRGLRRLPTSSFRLTLRDIFVTCIDV
jgi:hypothetical protein